MRLRKFLTACAFTYPLVLTPIASAQNVSAPYTTYAHVCPPGGPNEVHCHADVMVDSSNRPIAFATPSGYGPVQFHTAYQLPNTAPEPQTIGIVDYYDDPNIENDLNVYSQQYGLPSCTTQNGCFLKVNQNGQQGNYPRSNVRAAMEISLDVEIAHAICQNCKILLVEARSRSLSNLAAAEDTAANLGANVISNSYGGSESARETSFDVHYNHPGIAITASSGDNGFGVEYPAASQYVTAVGGTTLTLNSDNTRQNETAWSGAGSGCSAYEPKPSWQQDPSCANRTVADVSADADPSTGAAIYDSYGQGGWLVIGGTSLASPLIASTYALANNSNSVTYGSYPYSHTGSIYDVISGSNGNCGGSYLCTASPGYDGPTGLGTPIGTDAF